MPERDVILAIIGLLLGLIVLVLVIRMFGEPSQKIFASPEKITLAGESPETLRNKVIRCAEPPTKIKLDKVGFSYGKDAKFYVVFFYQGYVSLGDKPIEFKKESTPTITLESGPFSAVKNPIDKYVTIAFMTEYSECVSLAKEDPETKTNVKAEHFLKRCGAYIVDTLPPFPTTEVSCLFVSRYDCYDQPDAWCVLATECSFDNILSQYTCPPYTVCCKSSGIRTWGEISADVKKDVHPRTGQNVCIVTPKFKNTGSDAWTADKKIKARIYCDFIDSLGSIFYGSPVLSPGVQKYAELNVGAETSGDSITCADGKVYSIELLTNCVDEEFIGLPDVAGLPADCENKDNVNNLPRLLDSETVDCS